MSKYEFNAKTRKYIKERDDYNCVKCGGTYMLGIAHIWVSRAKGGMGVKENGVLLCQECHHALDNGNDANKEKAIRAFSQGYLRGKENLEHLTEDQIKDRVKYNKWKGYDIQ